MSELYFSTDVESDGPIPGEYSMLSFASAVYTVDKKLVSTFSANLELLPGAKQDPDTMAWWGQSRNLEAWAACRKDLVAPEKAMKAYVAWIKAQPGLPVFVAYPAGFDFLFVYWYLIKFAGESPFSFSALDVKSYAMSCLKRPYRNCTKKFFPRAWFDKDKRHTHTALDDAIEQGAMFINMMRHRLKLDPID